MMIPSILWTIVFYCFCTVIAIQVLYYLFFFRRLAFFKGMPPTPDSMEHPVSVVICARDEANNLMKNLPGILIQQYKSSHEVVLVNDN